jgi:hypothetical protein
VSKESVEAEVVNTETPTTAPADRPLWAVVGVTVVDVLKVKKINFRVSWDRLRTLTPNLEEGQDYALQKIFQRQHSAWTQYRSWSGPGQCQSTILPRILTIARRGCMSLDSQPDHWVIG